MYFLQPTDDLEHNIMAAIDNLALLLLTHTNAHFLEQFSKSKWGYVMVFQLVTLDIAELPSCSYILISRLIARRRK